MTRTHIPPETSRIGRDPGRPLGNQPLIRLKQLPMNTLSCSCDRHAMCYLILPKLSTSVLKRMWQRPKWEECSISFYQRQLHWLSPQAFSCCCRFLSRARCSRVHFTMALARFWLSLLSRKLPGPSKQLRLRNPIRFFLDISKGHANRKRRSAFRQVTLQARYSFKETDCWLKSGRAPPLTPKSF